MAYHIPVLLKESIEGLQIKPNGVYVDLTFGGGGHSKVILQQLKNGKLFGFDMDADAKANAIDDSRFTFIHQNFRFFSNYIRYYNCSEIDGIFADLGVSSHHFNSEKRGFSFRFNGKLDMRMNINSQFTAADIINSYSEEDLVYIFKTYGELHNAKKIAKLLCNNRSNCKIETISQLLNVLSGVVPPKNDHKFLAKVFQALRIEVNNEMKSLRQMLLQVPGALKKGGRFVVITYHSLEDREVKIFLKHETFNKTKELDIYGDHQKQLKIINKKVIIPNEEEIRNNNRARSAKLRIAEKI